MHALSRTVDVFHNGPVHVPPKVPLPVGGDLDPYLTHGSFDPSRLYSPSRLTIGSAVFAQLTVLPNVGLGG